MVQRKMKESSSINITIWSFGPNKKVRKMYSLLLYLINKPLISQFLKTICNTNTIDENEPCSKILSNLWAASKWWLIEMKSKNALNIFSYLLKCGINMKIKLSLMPTYIIVVTTNCFYNNIWLFVQVALVFFAPRS